MSQSTDSRKHISLMLSEVLDDIGVNDRMVMRSRRIYKIRETMKTSTHKSIGYNYITYYQGSRIEGTTTLGLNSDTDELLCNQDANVIQNWSEWQHGKNNFFMIQDENTSPGYCFLQLTKHDKPLPATVIPNKYCVTDKKGRILHKNIVSYNGDTRIQNVTRHGPSIASHGEGRLGDADFVFAIPCKSWPKSASGWLERQDIGRWPTRKMRRNAASAGCCVVPTGSKVSEYPDLDFRISTSLAERCLMFELDITQIKCYVLMKMILKSFLNPQGEINISSFMCKTVLLHCIQNKEASIWNENNLLECITGCMMELFSHVLNDNMPHFIIPENNLVAGQFTAETKLQLLQNIIGFMRNDVESLLRIDIDDLGVRLQVKQFVKLTSEPITVYNSNFYQEIHENLSAYLYFVFSRCRSVNHLNQSKYLHNEDIRIMKQYVQMIITCNNDDNKVEHAALTFLAPFLCSTYGSALASASIGLQKEVSPQALVWLLDGFESDVSSGRLKLASAYYSAGNMEKTELILKYTESQFYSYPVFPICTCPHQLPPEEFPAEVKKVCNEQNEDCVKNVTAFCVKFLKQEINCVPHELQYEMFRSTQDDINHRDPVHDLWMYWAVVDSLPFLYFLQYKVYRHLKRYQDQQQALRKLANIIETKKYLEIHKDLGHKETTLNLLGKCMEQENRPKQALKYYLLSLRQRPRNNVARIHICRLLSSLLVGQED